MSHYQSASTQQGRQWEDAVEFMLRGDGYTIVERHARVAGAEIDLIVQDPEGSTLWIECKGSYRGDKPGLLRDDTTKKLVGVAYHLMHAIPIEDRCPYICITSHRPRPGTLGERMLNVAITAGALAQVQTYEVR